MNFNFTLSTNSTVFSGSFIGGAVDMTNGGITTYEAATRATLDLVRVTYTINDIAGSMVSAGGATVRITEEGV